MFSEKYSVFVKEQGEKREIPVYVSLLANGDGNGKELPDDVYKIYDGLGRGTKTLKTYFSVAEFENKGKIEVLLPEVKGIKVKPEIEYTFEKGVFSFETDKDINFCIQPDGDIFGCLHIFLSKRKEPEENAIVFKKGIYTYENCEYITLNEHNVPVFNIKDNMVIHLQEGAIIKAAAELAGVKNVKICGNGIFSLIDRCHGAESDFEGETFGAFRYYALPGIYIRSGCENIEIQDVTLNCEFRGITIRNSEKIKIKNVKMFTSTENADGINCMNTSNLLVDGCYIQSADDCFCMYNSCDSIPTLGDSDYENPTGICRDVLVENCIMSSNARPFVLGGHATGNTEKRCLIENINVRNCKIIETPYAIYNNPYEYALYWSGFLRILSQSEQMVRNITFEDITVDVTKGHNGKPVHIEVRGTKNASYTESKGYRIENISFKNINIRQNTEKLIKSYIKCAEEENTEIDGVVFDNFNINGRKITGEEITVSGEVKNIEIIP